MTHSRGPWQNNYNNNVPHVAAADGLVLAHVYPVGDGTVGMANARLIAAAPDLLSLCEESLRYLDDMDICMYAGLDSHVSDLRTTVTAAKSPSA